jgi:hypothetical protein
MPQGAIKQIYEKKSQAKSMIDLKDQNKLGKVVPIT